MRFGAGSCCWRPVARGIGRWSDGLYDETVRRMYVDIPQAERMARAAVWLAAQLGDELAVAAGLRAMGHVLERKRRYRDALEQFQQALEIYERLGDRN